MHEDNNQSPGKKGKKKKGKTYRDIRDKAKNSKRKKVTVMLPAIIPGKGPNEPPSEYELSYKDAMLAVEMEKLAAKGLNNDEIIDALGMARSTFYAKLKEDPYFAYSLMKHRGKAVKDVEYSLYKNCIGFEYTEEQGTPTGLVLEVRKQKLPETKAQEFFLTNRDPNNWKKKVETTIQLGQDVSGIAVVVKRRE